MFPFKWRGVLRYLVTLDVRWYSRLLKAGDVLIRMEKGMEGEPRNAEDSVLATCISLNLCLL